MKGFRIFHDSEYFQEKRFFSKDKDIADKWINAIKKHAQNFDITKKYERMQQLGKGKFSTVYFARSLMDNDGDYDDDEVLAMKLIDKQHLTRKEREFLRDEIQIIRSISHPNVVEMHDAFETFTNMYIMMEVVQGGELFEHIKDYEISEREACLITN